jgi:DNA (cytosine-5)-methyltransferase 1
VKYLSVCSGIEAASVAWHPLGWEPVAFSEIEKFPSAVLAHHYPSVPNLGDMTKFQEWPDEPINLLVGGTPCQSFSVAGLRKGLADPRGNLMLTYGAIAKRYCPEWLVWENVPGVLSSNGGQDFGTFLGMLAELGYGFAYLVFDAQYFGVAQKRRRVFVVGCFGDWRGAAAVLFERESLSGNTPPSRQARQGVAVGAGGRVASGGVPIAFHHNAQASQLPTDARDTSISDALTVSQQAAVAQPVAFYDYLGSQGGGVEVGVSPTLKKKDGVAVAQAVAQPVLPFTWRVRRLTPVECERLQGFPDGYTNIPWRKKEEAPDGPRYKALGNSMAVPCMRWIGQRIKSVIAHQEVQS